MSSTLDGITEEVVEFADWRLEGCCDEVEYIFFGLYCFYGLLIHCLFHRTELLKPFKLLGVFVHEMGHASATWLTCGMYVGTRSMISLLIQQASASRLTPCCSNSKLSRKSQKD